LVLGALDQLAILEDLTETILFSVPLLQLAAGKAAITISQMTLQMGDLAAAAERDRQLQQGPQDKVMPEGLLMIWAEFMVLEAEVAQAQREVMAAVLMAVLEETARLVQ
jgi:hypothetical protein